VAKISMARLANTVTASDLEKCMHISRYTFVRLG